MNDPYGLIEAAEDIAARRWAELDANFPPALPADNRDESPPADWFVEDTCPDCGELVHVSQLTVHPCWWD